MLDRTQSGSEWDAPAHRAIERGLSGRIIVFLLRRLLRGLHRGRLKVALPGGLMLDRRAERPGPEAELSLHRWRGVLRVLTCGANGFGEGYVAGDWSSPDLPTLLLLLAESSTGLERTFAGILATRIVRRLLHALRANSRSGSRRNITAHYDLGNDFYALWLDAGMTYSAALYGRPDLTLEEAQSAKQERIFELLDLGGNESVLEIGCGWGTLAVALAARARNVTGITLSEQQLTYAKGTATSAGAGNLELRLQDYRDVGGTFDRVVSIEMIEAVGESYWAVYFEKLRACLRPGGRIVLQAITIDEERYDSYRRNTDFIQSYIFPGGALPTAAVIAGEARRAGLSLVKAEMFGASYVATLAEWRRRFLAAWPETERLGFGADFRRLWEYYLAYCEAGFRTGAIDVGLYVFDG